MAELEAQGLRKSYGGRAAVEDFSQRFADGRITTIVGPSGSGKTTTLWMLAGLIAPEAGTVRLDGSDLAGVPAERRGIGMVFQDYALFPHLSVRENVEFGLRVRGLARAARRRRAEETMALVRLLPHADRPVQRLSGGEQQRVALARALAFQPGVLLLDEPLSALDAKLREELRGELFSLLHGLAITTIYVTHDQVEAMSLGERLIVMHGGRIEQAGPPLEVYRRPANPLVARFLGAANILPAECVMAGGGRPRLVLSFANLEAPAGARPGACWVMIRPEDMVLAANGEGHFHAALESALFLGNQLRLQLRAGGQALLLDVDNDAALAPAATLAVRVKSEKISVWPREG
ncbi:MAG TPA: ABC transporter ATP-binding protein [Thermoanaerobaculia bacterium]|nr:ABC transporter ATP-binding protein [Thermoanaerobaculia bacterium]